MITYSSLLKSVDLEGALICKKLIVGDNLWKEARNLFGRDKSVEMIPVFNSEMQIVYFAKYDQTLVEAWEKMNDLQMQIDSRLWSHSKHFARHIHIRGVNDVLFQLREWLMSVGTKVSVEGEGWKIFGIAEETDISQDIAVIDEGCAWIDLLYAEYQNCIDDMPSYYTSFQVSDALIAQLSSSIMINYLYTGKPVCTYGEEKVYESAIIDYREELWYKGIHNVSREDAVLEFISRVEREEDLIDEAQAGYRKQMQENFDGNVCNRIYNYFEKMKMS